MTLTLEQWQELEALKRTALNAMKAFEDKVINLALEQDDEQTRLYLVKGGHRIFEAVQSFTYSIDTAVVSEWMGGNPDDPRNTKLREPQATGLSNRHYLS